MACEKLVGSISVVFDDLCGIGTGKTDVSSDIQKVGVDKPSILFLENSVEKLKNLPSQ